MGTYDCPNCGKTFQTARAPYRCTKEDSPECIRIDSPYSVHMGMRQPLELNQVFDPPPNLDHIAGPVNCPTCLAETTQRVCPECHCELGPLFDRVPTMVICVIGEVGSGKSTYIGVTMRNVMRAVGRFEATFNEATTRTRQIFHDHYEEPLFSGKPLQVNERRKTDAFNSVARQPLVYELRMKCYRRWTRPLTKVLDYNVIVTDVGGEVFADKEVINNNYLCLKQASCLIVLINPRDITGLTRLPRGHARTENHMVVLHNVISYFRQRMERKKLDLPVAIVLTSSDLLLKYEYIKPGSLLDDSFETHGRFDFGHCMKRSSGVIDFLKDYGEDPFLSQVRQNFKDYCFFCISSLGHDPKVERTPEGDVVKIGQISPRGVEAPFLWLFHKCGGTIVAR